MIRGSSKFGKQLKVMPAIIVQMTSCLSRIMGETNLFWVRFAHCLLLLDKGLSLGLLKGSKLNILKLKTFWKWYAPEIWAPKKSHTSWLLRSWWSFPWHHIWAKCLTPSIKIASQSMLLMVSSNHACLSKDAFVCGVWLLKSICRNAKVVRFPLKRCDDPHGFGSFFRTGKWIAFVYTSGLDKVLNLGPL